MLFGDREGDGDQDLWLGAAFYENIGDTIEASFRRISHIAPFFESNTASFLDMDGNGQVDSLFSNGRLLYKSLEPVTKIVTTTLGTSLLLATKRTSQVQLQLCKIEKGDCFHTVVLPTTAKELRLSTGDFNGNGEQDIVLAMIDEEGQLKIQLFNSSLQLIGSGSGGKADTVSVTVGRLNDDPADEYVVSLVQSDGRVAAISFNLNGSRVGKAVANQGKQPSVDVGQFDGTGDAYVLAYLTPDDQLETATFRGDATLIGQGTGGQAGHVTVTATDISPANPHDEYVISLIQSDGTLGLIGFASDGTRLGKAAGGLALQPKVVSGHFPGPNDTGLTVSLIQADNKPAIIFFDNKGKRLAKAVGGVAASVATMTLADTDGDGIEEGILVYIDEAGNPRWEVFGVDGIKK